MKLLRFLERQVDIWSLLFISVFFFFLRLPSLFEPYWYGDEGIYHVLGLAMNNGRLLYRDIWDNKPPLLYAVYAIFSADQFLIRLVSLLFGLFAVIAFFYLAKQLFPKRKIHIYVTVFFAFFFGIPYIEGNIANSENFMLFPNILAGLLIFLYIKQKKPILLIFSGLLLSISFLFKAVGVFDLLAFSAFLLISDFKGFRNILNQLKEMIFLFVSFFIPILVVSLYFYLNNGLLDFINATLKQNVGYVGYANTFFVSQGLLIIKLVLLMLFCLFLFFKRNHFSRTSIFVLLWVSFSLFNAFFSGRPYTHYVLVLLPSLFLLLGLCFQKDNTKQKVQPIYTFLLLSILIIVFLNFWFYKKSMFYYQNFTLFLTNQKSVEAYYGFFDRNTPKDYELASFLNRRLKKDESIFVWGNNAQLYVLTDTLPPGRFTVAYHMSATSETLQETEEAVKIKKPKFIIITSDKNPLPFNVRGYILRYKIRNALIYERAT